MILHFPFNSFEIMNILSIHRPFNICRLLKQDPDKYHVKILDGKEIEMQFFIVC